MGPVLLEERPSSVNCVAMLLGSSQDLLGLCGAQDAACLLLAHAGLPWSACILGMMMTL